MYEHLVQTIYKDIYIYIYRERVKYTEIIEILDNNIDNNLNRNIFIVNNDLITQRLLPSPLKLRSMNSVQKWYMQS